MDEEGGNLCLCESDADETALVVFEQTQLDRCTVHIPVRGVEGVPQTQKHIAYIAHRTPHIMMSVCETDAAHVSIINKTRDRLYQ